MYSTWALIPGEGILTRSAFVATCDGTRWQRHFRTRHDHQLQLCGVPNFRLCLSYLQYGQINSVVRERVAVCWNNHFLFRGRRDVADHRDIGAAVLV